MKLRITTDSIRFRVTPAEAAALAKSGKVESVLRFGPVSDQHLTYALEASAMCAQVEAVFKGRLIKIVLPERLVCDWARSNEVGIEHIEITGAGTAMKIIVEKDLKLQRPRPAQKDTPHF